MKGALLGSETGGGVLEGEGAETAKSIEALARIHVLTLSAEWGFHPAWMRESVEVFRVLGVICWGMDKCLHWSYERIYVPAYM
jgi:hypothetical protein